MTEAGTPHGARTTATEGASRRALLALLDDGRHRPFLPFAREMARLAVARGYAVVGEVRQERARPDPALFFGRGKVAEIAAAAHGAQADVVLVGASLTPTQQRNLEERLGFPVVDRTLLILEIFAERAESREGLLQVELARLNYTRPRLGGQGVALSRLGGGIGTRGPGETKLERDRRRIEARIRRLERELALLGERRQVVRAARRGVLRGVLVGYTNAGKSSLLEALAEGYRGAASHLFATLDPRVRRVRLFGNVPVVLTDSVGFVRDLPHELIHAFHATLEEVREADFLLHVVDGASEDRDAEVRAVESVLAELGVGRTPTLLVYNKADLLPPDSRAPHGAVLISATARRGLEGLAPALRPLLGDRLREVRVRAGPGDGRLVGWLLARGEVLREDWEGQVRLLVVRLLDEDARRFGALTSPPPEAVRGAGEDCGQEESKRP